LIHFYKRNAEGIKIPLLTLLAVLPI